MNKGRIENFRGMYEFLSSFHTCIIVYQGDTYNSVEHAFQAAKTDNPAERKLVRQCKKPAEAKRLGRRLTLRPDWEQIKTTIMKELLRQKFSEPGMAEALQMTGDQVLVHGNEWGDRFWGQCRGAGENWLGRLLMEVRDGL